MVRKEKVLQYNGFPCVSLSNKGQVEVCLSVLASRKGGKGDSHGGCVWFSQGAPTVVSLQVSSIKARVSSSVEGRHVSISSARVKEQLQLYSCEPPSFKHYSRLSSSVEGLCVCLKQDVTRSSYSCGPSSFEHQARLSSSVESLCVCLKQDWARSRYNCGSPSFKHQVRVRVGCSTVLGLRALVSRSKEGNGQDLSL